MISYETMKRFVETSTKNADVMFESAENDVLYGELLDETSFVEVVIDRVKAVFNGIAAILKKIVGAIANIGRKIGELITGSSSGSSSGGGSQTGGTQKGPRWNREMMEAVRSKVQYNDFEYTFHMHKWNFRYIESIPEKLKRFDDVQIMINGRAKILSANTFMSTLQESIDRNEFDLDIGRRYDEASEKHIPRIFQLSSVEIDEDEMMDNCSGGSEVLDFQADRRLIDDMIRHIESAELDISNVEKQVDALYKVYVKAGKDIDRLKLTTPADSVRASRYITLFQYILNHKTTVLSKVQKVNVRAIVRRANEYIRVLHQYVYGG